MVEGVLLTGGKVDRLIEEGEGRLLRDGLEELELRVAEGIRSSAASEGEDAEKLVPVVERSEDEGTEALGDKGLGKIIAPSQEARLRPGGRFADKSLAEGDGMEAQEALDG